MNSRTRSKRHPRRSKRAEPLEVVLTKKQLEKRADRAAQTILGLSSREQAFQKLDRGELEDTIAGAEFTMLRELLRVAG